MKGWDWSRLVSSPNVRRNVAQGLLLLLMLAVLFPGVFLRGEVIAPGDILYAARPWSAHAPAGFTRPANPQAVDPVAAFLPWYELTNAALRRGEAPLWNPLGFGGMPLLANYQSAVFYPPRLLHLLFGLAWGTTLFVLFKLWWCGMAAYWCGRCMGLGTGAARFLSIAWMLCGYNALWCQWPLTDVVSWLPLLLLGAEYLLHARWRLALVLLTLAGSMMLLAGHPETAFAIAVPLAAYFITRLLMSRPGYHLAGQQLAVCGAALAFALGICAVQLLPFLEYVRHSAHFLDRPGMESHYALPFPAIVGYWVPRFFGTIAEGNYYGDLDSNLYGMMYPGIAVWLGLFLLPAVRHLERVQRQRVLALIVAGGFSLGLAWGFPLFAPLHALPLFNTMLRCHHLAFSVFALPLLGAFGWSSWVREGQPKLLLLALGFGALVAALVWGIYRVHAELIEALGMAPYVLRHVGIATALAILLFVLLVALVRRPRIALGIATLVLAADLLYAARGFNPTIPAEQLYPPTALTDYLQSIEPPPRVNTATAGIPAGFTIPYGIEQWGAYDGLYPERMMTLQIELGVDLWNAMEPVCGISYYLHDPRVRPRFPLDDAQGATRFKHLTTLDGIEVYRNEQAYPRAFLVGNLELLEDRTALFDRMRDPAYEPAETVLAQPSPALPRVPDGLRGPKGASPGTAKVVQRTASHVVIEANASKDAVLVLNDAYFPGWRTTIDGEPINIFPAYYVFRGVLLPPGEHTIEFRYTPVSFTIGAWVSALSLVAFLFLAWRLRVDARASRP